MLSLDAFKDNQPEQHCVQIRLVDMSTINAPNVIEALFGNRIFPRFDKAFIPQFCEKAWPTSEFQKRSSDDQEGRGRMD